MPPKNLQIKGAEMKEKPQKTAGALRTKHGVPVYEHNPSLPLADDIGKQRRAKIGDDRQGVVIDTGSGEILGQGGAFVYRFEKVDKDRFVKLFLEGLKQAVGLSKAGLAVLEVVYNQLRDKPNTDTVLLYPDMKEIAERMTPSTYWRGVRELLSKEFLFKSPSSGLFFVNIRYLFNGDRLAFVKAYQLKQQTPPRRVAADKETAA